MVARKALGACLGYLGFLVGATMLPVLIVLYALKIGIDCIFMLLEKVIDRYTDILGWMLK